MLFTYSIVQVNASNLGGTAPSDFGAATLAAIEAHGGKRYGFWRPLFGMPARQFIWVTLWPDEMEDRALELVESALRKPSSVTDVRTRLFRPTVRPTEPSPPTRAGVYVHRWMQFDPDQVDEAVSLSAEAWKTFEHQFDSNVIGLFRETHDMDGKAQLLLITWYPDFSAWEESRKRDKDPESKKRFSRRYEMALENLPIATALLE